MGMTCDIESIRKMINEASSDPFTLSRFGNDQILFVLSQLFREVERLWSLYPNEATHNWSGLNERR